MTCLQSIIIRAISFQPYRFHPPAYSTFSSPDQRHSKGQPNRNTFPYPSHVSNPSPHQIFHLQFGASQQEIKSRYFDLVRLHHPDSSHIRTGSPPLSPDIAHARFRAIKAAYDFLSGKTISPHPNARPYPRSSNSASHFDPYLHELARRRRAHHSASYGYAHGRTNEDWSDDGWGPRRGWADGFGAPKDQQAEWNRDGRRERFVLSLGVMALLAGLFPSLPYTLVSLFFPHVSSPHSSTSANFTSSHSIVPDIYRNHREAASALSQVRQETKQVGIERREGVRRRVKEMEDERKEEK